MSRLGSRIAGPNIRETPGSVRLLDASTYKQTPGGAIPNASYCGGLRGSAERPVQQRSCVPVRCAALHGGVRAGRPVPDQPAASNLQLEHERARDLELDQGDVPLAVRLPLQLPARVTRASSTC